MCIEEGCTTEATARGLCKRHYNRHWQAGTFAPGKPGILPAGIQKMMAGRRRRGIPAEGVLFEGEK